MNSARNRIFEELAGRHRRALTGAAYHLCGDWEAACDLVQETLVDAYRGLDSLRDPEKAAAWLFTILRRKASAYRRTNRQEIELSDELAIPAPDDAETLIRGIVIEQLSSLAREDREILAGKYLLGLSYQELADVLGINEGAVRVRSFRAKEKLRELLGGAGVSVPPATKPTKRSPMKMKGGEWHGL